MSSAYYNNHEDSDEVYYDNNNHGPIYGNEQAETEPRIYYNRESKMNKFKSSDSSLQSYNEERQREPLVIDDDYYSGEPHDDHVVVDAPNKDSPQAPKDADKDMQQSKEKFEVEEQRPRSRRRQYLIWASRIGPLIQFALLVTIVIVTVIFHSRHDCGVLDQVEEIEMEPCYVRGKDVKGFDVGRFFDVPDPSACHSKCLLIPDCEFFALVKTDCFVKKLAENVKLSSVLVNDSNVIFGGRDSCPQ